MQIFHSVGHKCFLLFYIRIELWNFPKGTTCTVFVYISMIVFSGSISSFLKKPYNCMVLLDYNFVKYTLLITSFMHV